MHSSWIIATVVGAIPFTAPARFSWKSRIGGCIRWPVRVWCRITASHSTLRSACGMRLTPTFT